MSDMPSPPDEAVPTGEPTACETEPPAPEPTRALVERLLATEWPEPSLIESIRARGGEAMEPLREVIRRDPEEVKGWGFVLALNLLGSLGDPAALPDLLRLYRGDRHDVIDWLGDAVGSFGPQVLEPLFEIARDPTLEWYPREMALETAKHAAFDSPAHVARVAEVVRALLAGFVERARAGEKLNDDETQMASMLVCDLADLVDPEALDLIHAAYEADVVGTWIVDEESVERSYREGKPDLRPAHPHDWLDNYKSQLASHLEYLRRPAVPAPRAPLPAARPPATSRPAPIVVTPRPSRPVEPPRQTKRRPGRNDPCWCGSGKKYKKCHLGQDPP